MIAPKPVKERTLHTNKSACLVPEVDPRSFGSAKTDWRTKAQYIHNVWKVANNNSSSPAVHVHLTALHCLCNLTITGEMQRLLI